MRKIEVLNKNYEKIGLDTIVYVNKTIDEPIADLEGMSLKEVFIDNNLLVNPDFDSGTTGWISSGTILSSASNSVLQTQATAQYGNVVQDVVNQGANARMLLLFKAKLYGANQKVYLNDGVNQSDIPSKFIKDGTWRSYYNYRVMEPLAIKTRVSIQDNATSAWGISYFERLCLINMNIFSSPIDIETVFYWYDVFQARMKITKETFTLREFMALNQIENWRLEKVNATNVHLADGMVVASGSGGFHYFWESGKQSATNYLKTLGFVRFYETVTPYNTYYICTEGKVSSVLPSSYIRLLSRLDGVYGAEIGLFQDTTKTLNSRVYNSDKYNQFDIGIVADNATVNVTVELNSVGLFNMKSFDEMMTQERMDFIIMLYKKVKYAETTPNVTFVPSGKTKFDVAYTNKTIDEPIAELNGHTLREVFVGGNLLALYPSWVKSPADSVLTLGEINSLRTGAISTSLQFAVAMSVVNGNLYYINSEIAEIQDATTYFRTPWSATLGLEFTSNVLTRKSLIISANIDGVTETRIQQTSGIAIALEVQFKDSYIIDLISLGIQNLTVAQLNEYFALYQLRKSARKKYLTYSDLFETNDLAKKVALTFQTSHGSYINDYYYEKDTNAEHYIESRVQTGISANDKVFVLFQYEDLNNRWMNLLAFNINGVYKSSSFGSFNSVNFENGVIETMPSSVGTLDFRVRYSPKLAELGSTIYLGVLNYNVFKPLRPVVINLTKAGMTEITVEQIITLYTEYKTLQNIIIEPEVYTPIEPNGFGNRYKFKELNTKVYAHEMDFEKMQLTLLFGTYRNAYESFNLLMNFMINNEAIISYDYGKGIRYTDVRLIAAPKTELDNGQHMRSKFDFKRLSPFYTIEEGSQLTIENVHDWDIKPIVSGSVNTNIVYIEAEETTSGITIGVKFDFTSLTKPFNFYYNAETKQILINGINNGYQYIDFSYGVSFITLPKDTEHIVWTTGITSPIVKAKKWVID